MFVLQLNLNLISDIYSDARDMVHHNLIMDLILPDSKILH